MGPDGARNQEDCAGESQQQYTGLDLKLVGSRSRRLVVFGCIVSSRYLATTSEQTEDFTCAVVVKSVRLLLSFVVTSIQRIKLPIQTPCLVS
jgi:hypothetical protein